MMFYSLRGGDKRGKNNFIIKKPCTEILKINFSTISQLLFY